LTSLSLWLDYHSLPSGKEESHASVGKENPASNQVGSADQEAQGLPLPRDGQAPQARLEAPSAGGRAEAQGCTPEIASTAGGARVQAQAAEGADHGPVPGLWHPARERHVVPEVPELHVRLLTEDVMWPTGPP